MSIGKLELQFLDQALVLGLNVFSNSKIKFRWAIYSPIVIFTGEIAVKTVMGS